MIYLIKWTCLFTVQNNTVERVAPLLYGKLSSQNLIFPPNFIISVTFCPFLLICVSSLQLVIEYVFLNGLDSLSLGFILSCHNSHELMFVLVIVPPEGILGKIAYMQLWLETGFCIFK